MKAETVSLLVLLWFVLTNECSYYRLDMFSLRSVVFDARAHNVDNILKRMYVIDHAHVT